MSDQQLADLQATIARQEEELEQALAGARMKPGRHYLVVNIDEPYAAQVWALIRAHERRKGTWDSDAPTFASWVRALWGDAAWAEATAGVVFAALDDIL